MTDVRRQFLQIHVADVISRLMPSIFSFFIPHFFFLFFG
jgi:hypothetical protein